MEVKVYYLAAVVNGTLITFKVNLNPEGYVHLFHWLATNAAVSQFDLTDETLFHPLFSSEVQGLVTSTHG
jgi:hypothetical protein